MALQDIYKKASLVMKPAAMKEGKLYSQQPHSGDGDFTFSRANGTQTRINKHGLIEAVADNTPRLSYELDSNGNVSECPHLLLEPSRTNLLSYSSDFSNWSDSGVTVTSNDTLAPDGTQSADKLVSSANNWRKSKSFTAVNETTYTASIFVKLDTNTNTDTVQLEIFKGSSGLVCGFNLFNKTITQNTGLTDVFIEEYPNDWYRIGGTYTANGTTNIIYVYPSTGYSVSGTAYFWGAQAEAGSYATSYIPTEGSAAQREQDKCLNGGDVNLFNDSECTLFLDIENFSGNTRELTLSNGTSSNRVAIIFYGASNVIRFYVANSSGAQADSIFTLSYTFDQRNKIAFKYKQNDFKAYINGVQVFSDPSGNTLIGLSRFDFATASAASNFIEGKIHQAMILNEALSDSELIELTS